MRTNKKLAAVVTIAAAAILFSNQLFAQIPNFEVDPAAYQFAQKQQPYSWRDLADMALWTSGSQRTASYAQKIDNAVNALLSRSDLPKDARARGDYILTFMHNRYLTDYVEIQTRIDTLLDNGTFNCVSSAVFYTILAVSAGLDVGGVMTHDHAFVTLRANGALIDIETTNQYGFDPGRQKEFLDDFGNVTGYTYVDPKSYSDRTPISQLELVSLVLTNRISTLQTQRRFDDTLPLMANRAALLSRRTEKTASPFFTDPVKDLKENLLASAGALFTVGKYADVLQFAALANARYPDPAWQELSYACLRNSILDTLKLNRFGEARDFLNAHDASLVSNENYKALDALIYGTLNNAVATALSRNRFDEARNILDSNAASVSRDNYNEINAMICDVELAHLVSNIRNSADGEKALALLSDPNTVSLLSADRLAQLRSVAINNQAIYLSQEKGLRAAIQFAEDALKRYGRNANLENNLGIFRENRVTELHNTFAGLWNAGKHDAARAHLSDALKEFPGNAALTNDWNKIKNLK